LGLASPQYVGNQRHLRGGVAENGGRVVRGGAVVVESLQHLGIDIKQGHNGRLKSSDGNLSCDEMLRET
jgi:hypothetical protein